MLTDLEYQGVEAGIHSFRDDEGRLLGLAKLADNDYLDTPEHGRIDVLWVDDLVTPAPGNGRAVMQTIVDMAASRGLGVGLVSSTDSKGFYTKLGMRPTGRALEYIAGAYYWTPEDVLKLRSTKTLPAVLEDLEPEDGIFVVGRGGKQEKARRRWRLVDERARSWEERFRDAGRSAFEHDKREVLRLVAEAGKKARSQKATVNWQQLMFDVKQYLAFSSGENWRSEFLPALQGIVSQAAEEYATEFGLQFDLQPLSSYYWFEDYTLTFSDPIRATTLDAISQVLLQGQADGISVSKLQGQLKLLFEQWMTGDLTAEEFAWFRERMPAYRLELIVRTETMRAYNSGSFNTAKQWGAEFKEWIGTADDRIRDTHKEAWAMYSEGGDPGPIPMDRPFVVGGQNLMYPGDPSAHIRETANCRCTWAVYQPEFAEEEQAGEGFGQ